MARLSTRSALAAAACALVAAGTGTAMTLGQPVRDSTVAVPAFAPAPPRTSQQGPGAVPPTPTPAVVPAAGPAPRAATATPQHRAPRTARSPVARTPARSPSAPRQDGATPVRQLLRHQLPFARQLRAAFPWWPIG